MDAIKTAYSTAYNRLLLLIQSGKIGEVLSVDATCTSLYDIEKHNYSYKQLWNSICAWGPTAMLPIFQILGIDYENKLITSFILKEDTKFDMFTKINIDYKNATAAVKVGKGVKSEGELIISGTKGYVYVPAPWWKMDYFEIRYENNENNKRYFYRLDGEGIRYELVDFVRAVKTGKDNYYITSNQSLAIVDIIEDFYMDIDTKRIQYN